MLEDSRCCGERLSFALPLPCRQRLMPSLAVMPHGGRGCTAFTSYISYCDGPPRHHMSHIIGGQQPHCLPTALLAALPCRPRCHAFLMNHRVVAALHPPPRARCFGSAAMCSAQGVSQCCSVSSVCHMLFCVVAHRSSSFHCRSWPFYCLSLAFIWEVSHGVQLQSLWMIPTVAVS